MLLEPEHAESDLKNTYGLVNTNRVGKKLDSDEMDKKDILQTLLKLELQFT